MKSELHSANAVRHLTEAEFGEIVSGCDALQDRALTPAEEHLLTCEQCAAELEGLRESLALFRSAANAYANAELRHIPPVALPARRSPLAVFATTRGMYLAAAAALALAAFLPIKTLQRRSTRPAPAGGAPAATGFQHYATESNEALLKDVDQAASASVPDALQALADPAVSDPQGQKSN